MAQSKEPKDWKFILQSTGLPLEQSVKGVLLDNGISAPDELRFERVNELGQTIVASVDVVGRLRSSPFDVRVAVECKFRRDGVQWVFAPEKVARYSPAPRRDVLNIVTALHQDKKLNERLLSGSMGLPIVGKGVEIKGGDTADAAIRGALFQLRYGLYHLLRDYLEGTATDDPWQYDDAVASFVPIIVTTAELWRLNDGVGVEEVRDAESFEQIATQEERLIVYDPPDPVVKRELEARYREEFPRDAQGRITALLDESTPLSDFDDLASDLASRPSYFYVMSYKHFKKSTKSVVEFFGRKDLRVGE